MNGGCMSRQANEEKLLNATLDCIEREGLHNVTSRMIANQAGTNLASITYYFQSKDNLVKQALERSLRHLIDENFVNYMDRPDVSAHDMLTATFDFIFDGVFQFPNITKALFYASFTNDEDGGQHEILFKVLRDINEKIYDLLPAYKREEINMAVEQMMYSIMFIGLFPDTTRSAFGNDYSQENVRRQYVQSLINNHFKSL